MPGYLLPGMPRRPRLDAPGLLQHAMARGIERRDIFADDADRTDILQRIGAALEWSGAAVMRNGNPSVLVALDREAASCPLPRGKNAWERAASKAFISITPPRLRGYRNLHRRPTRDGSS